MDQDQLKKITIRDGSREDIPELISLLHELWPGRQLNHASLHDTFLRLFEHEAHVIRCACYDRRVVGLCSISIRNNLKAEGRLANIDELVVEDKMRGKQIGKLLLIDAEQIVKANNCNLLGLESSFYREDAHRFYEQNGYQKSGYYIFKALD